MPDVFDLAPKVELRVHLEGAIPAAALSELIERCGDPDLRSVDDLGDRFACRDYPHFIDTWWCVIGFIRTAEDVTHVAEAVAASMADQNIV